MRAHNPTIRVRTNNTHEATRCPKKYWLLNVELDEGVEDSIEEWELLYS